MGKKHNFLPKEKTEKICLKINCSEKVGGFAIGVD
jgi:hypothetical protein